MYVPSDSEEKGKEMIDCFNGGSSIESVEAAYSCPDDS